jgi:hypothetical protein
MIKQIILHKFLLEKKNVIACTSIMGAVILFFATIAADTYVDNTNIYRVDYGRAVNVANVAILFCFIYTASRMFRDLNSRKTAIQFLMLPASNKDKFLANIIMSLGGTFAMFIAALLGAELVQVLFNLAVRFTTGSIIVNFVENLLEVSADSIKDNFIAILLIIWAHAIFTLGSTIFRKHCLIKTILSLLGASLTLTMIIGSLAGVAANSNNDITIHFLVDPMVTFHITSYVIVIGTAIGAYYWAYRRFCNKTIL